MQFRQLMPESLAHRFIAAAIIAGLPFWVAAGTLSGYFYRPFVRMK